MIRRASRSRATRRACLLFGSFVLLGLSAGCGDVGEQRDAEPRPNVLLISLDTTRADRLGCYGYERDTSPHLDALATESVLYSRAISTSSWTLPAHASMFTGKFATSHGARYDPAGPLRLTSGIEGPESWDAYRARRLGNEHRTLAETLRDEGFATSAVVAGPWMKKVFGLSRGFESYDDDGIGTVAGRLAQDVTDAALGWIEGSQSASDGGEKPFFLFLNYYDPHSPYVAPPGFAERYLTPEMRQRKQATPEVVNALYDAEIHYMDHHIGRLFSSLREHGLYDSTWILVTADHGELLGEHGEMGHGNLLTQEELHIPFILKPPAGLEPPRRDDSTIQTTDVMPVILDRLGLDVPPGVQGAAAAEARPPVVSEVYPLPAWSPHGDWRTLIEGDSKFSWNSRGNHRLYRLDEDPAESNNLIAVMPARARAMQRKLQEFIESLPLPAPASEEEVELDPETREALESLGYVH